MSCFNLGDTCSARQYKNSKWVIVKSEIKAAAGALTGNLAFRFVSTGAGRFKSPHYEQTTYSCNGMIIRKDGPNEDWAETFSAPLASRVASTPTVTIANRYTVLNRSTYDHWLFTITPKRASDYLKRMDILFPSTFQWT
jgi:hypothetical protein